MNKTIKNFIFKIALLTAILFALSSLLFSTVLNSWYFASYPFQIIFIAVVTTMGHTWVLKASDQNSRRFNTAFTASTTLKLMAYLSYLLIALLIDHSHTIPFILNFIILYIIFTIFDVTQTLKIIKK